MVVRDDPIELSAGDTFVVRGRLQTSMLVVGPLPRVRGSGRVSGSGVIVTLPVGPAGTPVTYELESGVTRDPVDIPVCPL